MEMRYGLHIVYSPISTTISNSLINPLGDKVFNLNIQKVSFLQSRGHFSLSVSVLSVIYSTVITSRHLISMFWCKKCCGTLRLSHPSFMNLLCVLPTHVMCVWYNQHIIDYMDSIRNSDEQVMNCLIMYSYILMFVFNIENNIQKHV